MRVLCALLSALLLMGLATPGARAGIVTGQFLPQESSEESKGKISGLSWNPEQGIPVFTEEVGGEIQSFAILKGTHTQTAKSLIWDSVRVQSSETGSFQLKVPIKSKALVLELLAVSPEGELEREVFHLFFQNWEPPPQKASTYSVGAGPTFISYEEISRNREVARFSMSGVTAKFAFQRKAFFTNWFWGANTFLTLFSLSSSLPDVSVRFLGANLRLGYTLPVPKSPWRVTVSVGLYYARMFVSRSLFGYSDLLFPQFYPSLSREVNKTDSASLYLKYVPLGSSLFSSQERELAAGIGWNHQMQSGKKILLGLDFSDLIFSLTTTHTFRSSTFGLSAGYGF